MTVPNLLSDVRLDEMCIDYNEAFDNGNDYQITKHDSEDQLNGVSSEYIADNNDNMYKTRYEILCAMCFVVWA